MKWNILLGTVVLGFGLCTQSYGFELLDRMLGVGGGCGCGHHQKDGKDGKCDGKNGHHQKDGKCGCRGGLLGHHQKGDGKNGHCQKNGDGKNGHCQKNGNGKCGCGGGLLGHHQKNGNGKNGHCQKDGNGKGHCQKGCGGGLLDRLFACNRCCDGGKGKGKGKGCDNGHSQKDGPDQKDDGGKDDDVKAPMPPAPVVDPSAFLQTRRPVIQASSYVR